MSLERVNLTIIRCASFTLPASVERMLAPASKYQRPLEIYLEPPRTTRFEPEAGPIGSIENRLRWGNRHANQHTTPTFPCISKKPHGLD